LKKRRKYVLYKKCGRARAFCISGSVEIIDNQPFAKQAGEFSTIVSDLDGDGIHEIETDLNGGIVNEDTVTYDDVRNFVKTLDLPERLERRILLVLNRIEWLESRDVHYYKHERILKRSYRSLKRFINNGHRQGLIPEQDFEKLLNMIDTINGNVN